MTKKQINFIYRTHLLMTSGQKDELNTLINYIKEGSINPTEIGESLLIDDTIETNDNNLLYHEVLQYFVDFCSYVENETSEESIISDELYDQLVEKIINLGESQPIGSIIVDDGKVRKGHQYPELRGSLSKVHFISDKDIPTNDARKSLESYFRKVINKIDDSDLVVQEFEIYSDMKFDGVSHIIEVDAKGNVESILTRGDVKRNLGVDITKTMKRIITDKDELRIEELNEKFNLDLPIEIMESGTKFGLKVETYMTGIQYTEYTSKYNTKLSNRRSAVTSICNQDPDSISEQGEMYKYLSMEALQISYTCGYNSVMSDWKKLDKINDRNQLLHFKFAKRYMVNANLDNMFDPDAISSCITDTIDYANKLSIPIDGVVLTIMDNNIVNLLGRNDDKNSFQVAYKFPAGVAKTIVEKVDFQIGPITGALVPMARLKPIKLNGNTISNVSLANKEKMERLNIHEGDEVIIKYDIVPTIFKDDTCKESDKPLVKFPEVCPICGEPIHDERCVNTQCHSKVVGRIYNFVERNKLKGIGVNTIVDLVEHGFIEVIGDLYRLYLRKGDLCNLEGYGQSSVESILSSISKARKLYPHQILGALGIPSIGFRIMEKVCRNCNVLGSLGHLDELYSDLVRIQGIGDKTAHAIIEGISNNMGTIEDICSNVEIKPYEKETKPKEIICFSGVRDSDFETYLEDNGNKVSNSFTGKTTMLVVSELPMPKPTSKYNKAVEKGIQILSLDDAKKHFGFC